MRTKLVLLLLFVCGALYAESGDSTWKSLFDGKTLKGWKETDFAGRGEVAVNPDLKGSAAIVMKSGYMTGITYTNAFPTTNYEIELEAMRVDGSDFFCGLTFPVGENHCSFIVGGWGGGVVGLSSLDGADASENETTRYMRFDKGEWYKIRLKVTPTKIEAWIGEEPFADVEITGKRISIRPEVDLSKPLGISTWSTTGALKNLRYRELKD